MFSLVFSCNVDKKNNTKNISACPAVSRNLSKISTSSVFSIYRVKT